MNPERVKEIKQIHESYLTECERHHREFMRNLKGAEFEKKGKLENAIALYELNVDDCFVGLHPYKRLAIIYSKFKLYSEVRRVLTLGIENVHGENHRQELSKRLQKLGTSK